MPAFNVWKRRREIGSEVEAGRKGGSGRRNGNIMMDFTALFRRNVATVEKMEGDGGGNLGKEQQSVVLRKGEGEGRNVLIRLSVLKWA